MFLCAGCALPLAGPACHCAVVVCWRVASSDLEGRRRVDVREGQHDRGRVRRRQGGERWSLPAGTSRWTRQQQRQCRRDERENVSGEAAHQRRAADRQRGGEGRGSGSVRAWFASSSVWFVSLVVFVGSPATRGPPAAREGTVVRSSDQSNGRHQATNSRHQLARTNEGHVDHKREGADHT